MILVRWYSKLKLYNESWPEEIQEVPHIGHKIESKTIWKDGFQLILKVVGVQWRYISEIDAYIPFIELADCHDGRGRADFYMWYAPLVEKTPFWFVEKERIK
jgi:hypothetical protein